MAITKILYMKDCGVHNPGKHLKQAIDYILVPEKTGEKLYVSGVNCQPEYAYKQMKATKVQFGKTDKRQGYHIIISFEEGEVDARTAFEIVGKFVDEYLKDEYEAVYAVHDNTDHIHGHIIFNSVSFLSGKKFRYKKGDWAKYIQPITNRLCEEYGLSTISVDGDRADPSETYTEWRDYRDGKFAWSDMIKRDIDASILSSDTFDEFVASMVDKGYEVKQNKYLAVKPPGLSRFRRCYHFGDDYTEERIRERIIVEDFKYYQEHHSEARILKVLVPYHLKRAKLSGMQRKYFAKLYRLGKLKQRPYSQAYKYRDEIRKMHKLHDQYMFLADKGIHTREDLLTVYEDLKTEKADRSKARKDFYKKRATFKPLWDKLDRLEELNAAEFSYNSGDTFFVKEHEEYKRVRAEIDSEGYTVEELSALRSHYKQQSIVYQEERKKINKDIRTAESLIREQDEAISAEKTKEVSKGQPKR